MTTRDPGARDVFTHGLTESPRSTARLAISPAATSTWGLDVFVQLVIAAITTFPSLTSPASFTAAARGFRPSAVRKARPAPANATLSCGRDGPARLGTTVERSRSTTSE